MSRIFITGATGFLGRACLESLLESEDVESVDVLVRNPLKSTEYFRKLLGRIDGSKKRLNIIVGDVRKKRLGITKLNQRNIRKVDEVYHLAGSTSLSDSELEWGVLNENNVVGTWNVLNLFCNSDRLDAFYHCSTAYVAGATSNEVPEDWVDVLERPRNNYEKSKWQAEEIVRDYSTEMPIVVLRPSILCLDNNQFDNDPKKTIYSYAKVLARSKTRDNLGRKVRIVGDYDSALNLIKVSDFVGLLQGIRTLESKAEVYNMTGKGAFSIGKIIDWVGQGIRAKGYELVSSFDGLPNSEAETFVDTHTSHFKPYLTDGVGTKWEYKNTESFRDVNFLSDDVNWMKEHILNYSRSLINEGE